MGTGRSGKSSRALIRQHSRIQHQQMLAQEEDTVRRKMARKAERKTLQGNGRKRRKFLYIPTVMFMGAGIIMTLGSTIRGLGEGTVFWARRERFTVIGPVVLAVGVVTLLVTVGVLTHLDNKRKNKQTVVVTVNPVFTEELSYPLQSKYWYIGDKSSIPIMAFEEEEFYMLNVRTKPMEHTTEYQKSNNNNVLSKKASLCLKNNFPEIDFSWPDSLKKKYKIDENMAYSSLPLLPAYVMENKSEPGLAKTDSLTLDLTPEVISKLPESYI